MLKIATKFSPTEKNFETAREAGFRHAELWLDDAVLHTKEKVAALARRFGMEHVLHFPNQLRLSPQTLKEAADLYRELQCPCMVIHQPQFDAYAAELRAMHPGIRLAVENHRLNLEELDQWAETNPGLTLDVEHTWKFTLHDAPLSALLERIRALFERHGHKIRHIHLPGYLPGQREHRPMYCAREMILPVLSILDEFEFRGLIVSEADVEFQRLNDLRMDLLLCDTWRQMHGDHKRTN